MEDRKEKAAINDELLDKIAGGRTTETERRYCTYCREKTVQLKVGLDLYLCYVCGRETT